MSHDLEIINGKASFASLREPAWHSLGQIAQKEMTTQEIMKLAILNDWNVRAIELENFLANTDIGVNIKKQIIIRDNPAYIEGGDAKKHDILGVVGGRYGIVQNEEVFEFGQALLGDDARWETAGSIKKGTTVFGTIALEMDLVIDENGVADQVKTYLMLSTTHDGSGPLFAGITPVRVVCANTYNMAIGNMSNVIKIRHTKNARSRMDEVLRVQHYTKIYQEKFAESATSMFETSLSDQKFYDLVLDLYPKPDSKAGITRWGKKIDAISELWDGPTQEGTRGTVWGAFGALTEDAQWNRAVRQNNMESFYAAGSGFDSVANSQRQDIFERTLALV